MLGEIEVVHVQVEARTFSSELLLGILQEEGGLAHSPCALDADKPVFPVDFIHQSAAYGSVRMLHQILMCSVKCFHLLSFVGDKDSNTWSNCKVEIAKCVFFLSGRTEFSTFAI